MSEQNQNAPATTQLFDNIWGVEPAQPQVQQQAAEGQAQQEPTPAQVQPEPTPAVEPTSAPTVDYNSWVKTEFGFENVDEAKQQFERVKNFKEPEPIKFENEASERVYNLLREGKLDEVYSHLDKQSKLNRLTSSTVDNTTIAGEIIKLGMQQTNPELTVDDADFMFNKKFAIPPKPQQDVVNESDEDYSVRLANWEQNVKNIEREMLIEAKMIKPTLEKIKSELKLPEITAPQQTQQEPTVNQEELDRLKQVRDSYVATLNEDYSKFEGFNAQYKDEEVDFTVPYTISDEEKTSLKAELENFDSDAFFEERWFTKEGRPNVNQMMADLYLLKNRDRIFQKIANEAGSQRLLAKTKQLSNVQVNGNGQNTFVPDQKNQQQQLLESIWNN
jgi:hypothetical protein